MSVQPYKSTPVFTLETLPDALRRDHALKPGVWGVLSVLSGSLRYVLANSGRAQTLRAGDRVTILPEQRHHVEPLGEIEMRVDFYDRPPS